MWIDLLLLLSTLFLLWRIFRKPQDYPPGPWSLPLIGYFPLGSKIDDNFMNGLRSKYGNIVSMKVGIKTVVLIFDFQLVREAFVGFNVADRPTMRFLSFLNEKDDRIQLGIVSSNGNHWRAIRRFSLHHLRNLGMGKSKIVIAIQNEALDLVENLKKQTGKPAPLPHSFTVFVLNVVWQIVASKRYDVEDKEIQEFDSLISSIEENCTRIFIEDFYPWLKYVIPKSIYKKLTFQDVIEDLGKKLTNTFQALVNEHLQNLNENETPKDFIDAYLIEMNNQKDDPSSPMSIKDLMFCIGDLFRGGTETTTTTLKWGAFYLASHPDVQTKLQKEIDEVLPKGTLATLDDKLRLPYTEAFIHETLRYSSLIPFGAFHSSSADTNLNGYRIPKDACVLGAVYHNHYDSQYFENPDEFRPERFINPEGKFVAPKDGFLPFGTGKRQCMGEGLAKMELLIFITTMVQNLNFAVPSGYHLDLTPEDNVFFRLPRAEQNLLITSR